VMTPGEWSLISNLLLGAAAGMAVLVLSGLLTLPPASVGRALRQRRQAETRQYALQLASRALAAEFPGGLPVVLPPPAGRPDPGSAIPPRYLYHGTSRANLASFVQRGLEGRKNGWAFMAPDLQTAEGYAAGGGLVFRILAQRAYQNGVHFVQQGPYYVAQGVHPGFIDFGWSLLRNVRLQ